MKNVLFMALIAVSLVGCGKGSKTKYQTKVVDVATEDGPGMTCKLFDLTGLGTAAVPDFSTLPVLDTISVNSLNNPNSGTGDAYPMLVGTGHESIVEQIGMQCTAKFVVDTAGAHTFYVSSDDGSNLYVNGILVVANDGPHGVVKKSGTVTLPKGEVSLKLEYFNEFGPKALILSVKKPGGSEHVLEAKKVIK